MVVALTRSMALVAFFAFFSTQAHASSLQARLSSPAVQEGQEVVLQLRSNTANSAVAPDLSPLEDDFEILGTQQSQRLSIVNGRREASIDWIVTLLPRRKGQITVPAIHAGRAVSAPLRLEVLEAGSPTQRGDAPDLFVESSVDPESPYVQSEFRYTVKVYDGVGVQGGTLTEPRADGARVTPIGEGRVYEENVEGRTYQVHEREYAIRPSVSGSLEIAPVVLEARVRDSKARRRSPFGDRFTNDPFFQGMDPFGGMLGMGSSLFGRVMNPGRPVRVRSNTVSVEVQPRPGEATEGWFLPAAHVELQESFDPEISSLRVGEATTRTVQLRALGVSADQLPEFAIPAPARVRQYDEGSRKDNVRTAAGAIAVREEKVALVPSEEGWAEFPAMEVRWWDTGSQQERVATLPSRRVEILPPLGSPKAESTQTSGAAAPMQAIAAEAGSSEASDPSTVGGSFAVEESRLWVPGFLAGAILVGGALVLRKRRKRLADSANPDVPSGRVDPVPEIERACRCDDALRTREQFLVWARERLGSNAWSSPRAIAHRLGDADLIAEVENLDRALYSPEPSGFVGQRFWEVFRRVDRQRPFEGGVSDRAVLPRLYPST